mmetsp:Transcript_13420/g.39572  ORF Transcript_13420/g.39572 Transcript_13420/m.39572 type:complete len:128 (-) Transcript_13420:579-962(-)
MPYTRFIEIGRIALVNYGPDKGKLCTIVDVVDENRVVVDGPVSITGVQHQVITTKRLALTEYKVNVMRNARQKALLAAWEEADVMSKWQATAWAKKIANKKKRSAMSDFDRFEVMIAKKKRTAAMKK